MSLALGCYDVIILLKRLEVKNLCMEADYAAVREVHVNSTSKGSM